ncbi:hypothetical protein C2845_PM10G11860 [Panicum miliaceum]|uniref:Uncharacterized protein n=1 Tax=Panicum miliaceum TaxID=4540 RepID=A0A3L6PCB8_PANMI|nr:hypothetical protein C2845_PM10G11860 [Panicum miliaceum]
MARIRQTARKSTRGPPHPIQHPQEVPEQEEPVQPEDAPVFMEIDDDDDDDYYGYYGGGWVDTDIEEEPMELPEDHPDAAGGSDEDTAGGDGVDPNATGGDDAEDGGDDPAAPDGGDDDPDDDPEPAAAADVPPPEPHYEKQIHHLDFAEGPFPALLWRAMQRIGSPLMPRYEASLFKNAQQEEEWLVSMVISVLDERYGSRMEYYKHSDNVPRKTLDAGTSEAARRALYYLYHAYRDELQGTEFQQFPRRMKGATNVQIPVPPPGEGSLLMDTIQELVVVLSTDLDAAGAEIQEVKRKLRKTLKEKANLEAQLRGDRELPPGWRTPGLGQGLIRLQYHVTKEATTPIPILNRLSC